MAYYVVHALDKADKSEIRLANRPAHRARLRNPEEPVRVHVGGPLLDDAETMIGTMLIVEANDRSDVETFLSGDPYTKAGLYRSVQIHPYLWGIGEPGEENG